MKKKSQIETHFDLVSHNYDTYKKKNTYYYTALKKLLGGLIPKRASLLEVGCGTGDILVSLSPKKALGIDISRNMIAIAKHKHSRYKNIKFRVADILNLKTLGRFDYVLLVDVIEHLEKSKESMRSLARLMSPKTALVITMANPVWEPVLMLAEKFNLKMPEGPHKRIQFKDIQQILDSVNLNIAKHEFTLLLPIWIPVVTPLLNKLIFPHLKKYAFIEYIVAVKGKK